MAQEQPKLRGVKIGLAPGYRFVSPENNPATNQSLGPAGRPSSFDPHQLPLKDIEEFCHRYAVEEFALFGSILRDDFSPDSDVDVMLKFKPGSGFTFENTPDIQDDLRRIFGRNIDVIEMGRIRNPIRRREIMGNYRVIHTA